MPAALSGASCGRVAINSPHSKWGKSRQKKVEESKPERLSPTAKSVSQLLLQLISGQGTVGKVCKGMGIIKVHSAKEEGLRYPLEESSWSKVHTYINMYIIYIKV